MQIALGPVTYYWNKARMFEFYRQAAQSDVDIVYLGEVVCSKRRELSAADYLSIARTLREAGKQVVISTLTLIEAKGELKELRRYCDNSEFMVEANDIGAVQALSEQRLPFTVGPAINVYNADTLAWLLELGLQRWTMPVELSRDWLMRLLADDHIQRARNDFEVEVFAFGYLPLAWSARCFTARSENRSKDDCGLRCSAYPEGRSVQSQDGKSVFRLNGIQTQSGARYNLINALADMPGLVDVVRLCPQYEGTFTWVENFRAAARGETLREPRPLLDVDGYWHRLPGMEVTA